MRRRRYQTHADIHDEARARARAGLHPEVVAASQVGGVAAPPEAPAIQRVSGELPRQQANRPTWQTTGTSASPPAGYQPVAAARGLDPTKLAGSMGGTAADLGIARNGEQAYRRFIGGDGLEHHVYADGRDVRVAAPQGDQSVALKIAAAAREAPSTDLSAVQALPPEQQQALMVLASAAAAQRAENAANPALMLRRRRR